MFLKCRKNTKNLNSKISESKNNRSIMQSKCGVCGSRKSRFVKKQKAKGFLSSLGLKTLIKKVLLLVDNLFQV